jgi:methyl-accepting chemotaxis protein
MTTQTPQATEHNHRPEQTAGRRSRYPRVVSAVLGGAYCLKALCGRSVNKGIDDLAEAAADLQGLISSTEHEFLQLGSKLQHFRTRAGQLSEQASAVAGDLSGDAIETVMQGFESIAGRIRNQEHASDSSITQLTGIERYIESMQSPLDAFDQTVKTLNVLAVYTRIENAQLDSMGTGFDTLADNIQSLAVAIKAKSDEIVQQTRSLRPLIHQAAVKIHSLKQVQLRRFQDVLATTASGLDTLKERNALSADAVRDLAAQYATIQSDIGEIVSSMQFHDIIRQKVEHVSEALDGITGELKGYLSLKKLRSAADLPGCVQENATIGRLQAAQLQMSSDEIHRAVTGISASLRSIRRTIAAMCGEIERVTGGGSGSSFLKQLESGVQEMGVALQEYGKTRRDVASIMDSVAGTVRDVARFIRDIQQIGLQVERIALNAQIRAAHIGSRGEALGEIAEAIQGLSRDTKHITEDIACHFSEIAEAAQALHQEGAGEESGTRDTDTMLCDLEALMTTIDGLNRRITHQVDAILAEGEGMAGDIQETVGSITVHERIEKRAARAIAGIGAFVEGLMRAFPLFVSHAPMDAESLRELEERYTMHSEREVHRSITGGEASPDIFDDLPSAPQQTEDAKTDEDELGDNVELF